MYDKLSQEIINRVSMSEMFKYYGFNVNRAGFVSCPFHKEKTASMKAYQHDKGFYCFGCGKGGSVINFVMLQKNLDFNGAVKVINNDFRLGLPIDGKITLRQKRDMLRAEKERQEKLKLQQKKEEQYWSIFDEWKRLDLNIMTYKPNAIDEELHPLFVEALQKISYQEYLLSMAEIERAVIM